MQQQDLVVQLHECPYGMRLCTDTRGGGTPEKEDRATLCKTLAQRRHEQHVPNFYCSPDVCDSYLSLQYYVRSIGDPYKPCNSGNSHEHEKSSECLQPCQYHFFYEPRTSSDHNNADFYDFTFVLNISSQFAYPSHCSNEHCTSGHYNKPYESAYTNDFSCSVKYSYETSGEHAVLITSSAIYPTLKWF
ncbi:hypothetical protein AB205_0201860 [Aquarana catesbeiana]|uniref:Uncharacterized protein n=1 Tax=Aquarana catesbeiana TaxID=8400 RepID=A0A2G9QKP9_AQUCT|nr:hypothetical protein AB205_0201860 [Aquarana catesbeiana]